jgi:branched-chain amino acid aminotransferase
VREVSGRLINNPNGPITQAIDDAYWAMRGSGEYGTPL